MIKARRTVSGIAFFSGDKTVISTTGDLVLVIALKRGIQSTPLTQSPFLAARATLYLHMGLTE